MSTTTASRRYLVAQAAIRADAIMHLVSERDSGALNPVCGAHPVRSREINLWPSPAAALPADLAAFCPDCADFLLHVPGIDSIEQGIATMVGAGSSPARTRLLEIPLELIVIDEARARRDGGDIEALAASVAEHGVLQPVIVRHRGSGYELVSGLRRFAAARMVDLTTIPALVRVLDDQQTILDALTENLHRADLNPIDQAHAYQHALTVLDCSKADLGRRLRISREQISNTIRLLALPADAQQRLIDGDLTAEGGRALLRGAPAVPAAKLPDVAALLEQLLAAKVAVTQRGDSTRFVIDVPNTDRARFLAQFGQAA